MSGAHFLVVAGPDLHDRAIRDAGRGNGVYESVFGWRLYVPCIWDAPERLLEHIVDTSATVNEEVLRLLTRYLRFKARGVPRRLLQEINSFVAWEENCPRLAISAQDMERVEFYSYLELVLGDYFDSHEQRLLIPVPIDQDRWRLAGYYVADWVLRSEGEPFSATDLLRGDESPEFDPLLRISRRNVDRLLDHLAERGILEVVRDNNAMATVMADIAESNAKVFRLSEQVKRLLYGFAALHELERTGRGVSLAPSVAGELMPLQSQSPKAIGGRYELSDLIRQGGISSVYKGHDMLTGRQVVIKLLRTALTGDPVARARFQCEIDLAMTLRHPHVAQAYELVDTDAYGHVLIREWLRGPSLEDLIGQDGPMRPAEVAAMGRILGETLDYIASEGIVRLDLKPSTVVMADRGPVITDLEVAVRLASTSITSVGQFVGTPEFMAPELIEGSLPDQRTDIYSLGLLLYYSLAGGTPWADITDRRAVMVAILHDPVDVSVLGVSAEFAAVIGRAIARDSGDRFASGSDLQAALLETPEHRSLSEAMTSASFSSRRAAGSVASAQ